MHIGIDIGGTKILALVVGPKGEVVGQSKKKLKETDPVSVLKRAFRCAEEACDASGMDGGTVEGVGIAVPSSVNDGRALFAPALGWRDVPVAKLARRHYNGPVFLGNDVNLGVAAEYLVGAARGAEIACGFFIGTGVGGAVIHIGKLLRGEGGLAGELGHIVVAPDGRRCGCGNVGCLEAYASKTAILGQIKDALREGRRSVLREEVRPEATMISSSQLHAAYVAGDELAREAIDGCARWMGLGVASVINVLSPSRVVLGGGVVAAFGAPLVRRIRAAARPHIFGSSKRARVIVQSQLGDDAVPLGAALLAQAGGDLL